MRATKTSEDAKAASAGNVQVKSGEESIQRLVKFIQNDEPPVKDGEYTLTVSQTTNTDTPNSFSTSRKFAVKGERFTFQPGVIDSMYPPELASGDFDGSLANVVLTRRTLPWERYLDDKASRPELPWLAVLLFDAGRRPTPWQGTASDLVPENEPITVAGNDQLTGTGKMSPEVLSYPGMKRLEYGERPDDLCTMIDIDLTIFNQIAPSMNDMNYLAHIRKADTIDTTKNVSEETEFSVVLGNRIAMVERPSYACLVSLEKMGSYLPDDDGVPAKFPDGKKTIRLICYRWWRFTATKSMDQNLKQLLENLNERKDGKQFTTIQLPVFDTLSPSSDTQVEDALAAEGSGTLDADKAKALALNAFRQGYVPMNHEMRHADRTVSWYRGPCRPSKTSEEAVPTGSADGANHYNPQTGLFDVSYGAAWQLGRLMALQNKNYSNALFNWKKAVNSATASQAEQQILNEVLGSDAGTGQAAVFAELINARQRALDTPSLPDNVSVWLAKLRLLYGVPFNYLVPREEMLPLESLRFFYLDLSWINHLVDGAFSIGRTSSHQQNVDATLFPRVKADSHPAKFKLRQQRAAQVYAANDNQQYTGFLLRSQVIQGWPNLQINGYATPDDIKSEIKKLRMDSISPDCIICIFDGEIKQLVFHEPPEQLHCGIEFDDKSNTFSTTLRAVTDNNAGVQPGEQLLTDPKGGLPIATIPMRSDEQTVCVSKAAISIFDKLNADFSQGIEKFTSAEFALEMVKGAIKVDFDKQD